MKIYEKNLPPNKHFGYLLISLAASAAIYFLVNKLNDFALLFLFLSLILFVITRFDDGLLSPFNRLWMKLGLYLSIIVSPVIFGIIFFGLFTPVSFLMKIFGRDELRLSIPNNNSYWRKRKVSDDPSKRFKLQF